MRAIFIPLFLLVYTGIAQPVDFVVHYGVQSIF